MPSGKTHDGLTWGAAFPLAFGIGWYGEGWVSAAIFGAGFLFGGLMFGPDLDLPSVQTRRWGPLRGIWLPYQRMFRHRSGWTHGFFVGPLVRILYLGVWVGLMAIALTGLVTLLGGVAPSGAALVEGARRQLGVVEGSWLAYGLLGIWGGSALHTAADGIVSWFKRRLRFGKPRR